MHTGGASAKEQRVHWLLLSCGQSAPLQSLSFWGRKVALLIVAVYRIELRRNG